MHARYWLRTWLILCAVGARFALAEGDWTGGMEGLYRLDRYPLFRSSVRVASISSYDRTGGNDDGFSGKYSFVRKEPGGLVLADLKGPGVVFRIWTPTPTDDPIEFYFDGEKAPRMTVKFRDLFTGKQSPFVDPLVGYGAGGFYSYVPLPFENSCKIVAKAERVQFYQINYALYPEDAPVETIELPPGDEYLGHQEKARKLFASFGTDVTAYVVPRGAAVERVERTVSLQPGKTVALYETETPGRICGIRLAPASALEGKGRDLLLRVTWDGDEEPAVLCPVGDFFGYAWGKPAVTSLLVGTAGGVNYCYFPMPFDRSARIELVSERNEGPAAELRAEFVFAAAPRSPREGKFYAVWRRENPTRKGVPFTFVKTAGRGHVVGCVLQAQGLESGNTYFFEGDDQTTIDGELAIHGTGSEDFFNGGWYDVPGRWEKRLSFPLSGCLGYQKALGRTGGYRILLGDVYAYRKSILQTIEHSPTENSLLTDYCAVTYLYSEERPTCDSSLPAARGRRVVDFEKLVFTPGWYIPIHAFTFKDAVLSKRGEKLGDENVRYLSMTAQGKDWFGDPFLSLVCDIPAVGRYAVSVEAVMGPAQARVQLFLNEAPVGEAVDFYAEERQKSALVPMGRLTLSEGPNNLMFKLVGKNPSSTGLGFDVIRIVCEKLKAPSATVPSIGD